ncbi:hypothetical protein AYI69_g894 [Smittium culicis]|uniref:Uncharacterized protein n=1 Tax=Smittium culicis TaxID=133412 RepID=A0A1R1YRW0_9FUNG|nr:hypothetical protein AYI69_g894 [Smittium culicis]
MLRMSLARKKPQVYKRQAAKKLVFKVLRAICDGSAEMHQSRRDFAKKLNLSASRTITVAGMDIDLQFSNFIRPGYQVSDDRDASYLCHYFYKMVEEIDHSICTVIHDGASAGFIAYGMKVTCGHVRVFR